MGVVSTGQITIVDMNDVNISTTPPASPVLDQLWLDTSVVPNELKRWDGTKWTLVGDSRVEGRNLIKNTDMGGEIFRYDHVNKIGEGGYNIGTKLGFVETPKALEQYTISLNLRGTGRDIVIYLVSASGNTATTIATQAQMSTTTFKKFNLTFTAPAADISNILVYTLYRSTAYTAWFEIEPKSLKLERGSIATDWTPAPEDIEQKVTTINTSVEVLSGQITSKAEKSVTDGLDSRLTSAEQKIKPESITTTVTSSATYLNDKIQASTTAPGSPAIGKLWLDTSKTPNALMRWTGAAWVKASPQDAADVGAYTKGQVYTKEETATQVQMKFDEFQVGGENLIKESHKLSDKFETYQDSTITVARDNEPVPAWGAENATVIITSSLGTSDLKARWVISDDLTFMAGKEMVFSIYAKNNRGDQPVTISTNRIGEPITLAKGEMRKLEFVGVLPENDGKFLILELRAPTAAYYLGVTLWHPKWELGDKPTEWSPHPEEFYAGMTKIDREGVEVSRSDQDIKSRMAYDGLTVKDGDEDIAVFGETTYMPYANIDVIDSLDVVGTVRENISYEIGAGKDYTTVSEALDIIFKGGRTTLLYDTNINLYLNGNITDEIILKGIEGNGRIYLWFRSGARLYGRIWARDCKVRIYVRSQATTGTGRGLIKNTSSDIRAIWNESSSYVNVISVDVDNGGKTHGIVGNDAGETSIQDCDISNASNAITSNFGSDVRIMKCRGSNNGRSVRIQTNATLFATGTIPDATAPSVLNMDGFYIPNGTVTNAPSTFNPPAVTDKDFTKTFAPSYLKTQTPDGKWSTYYGDKAAQNRWDSPNPYATGFAAFGADVKSYIDDRKTGTTPTIEIRLRRSATSHGSSNAIPPDPNNFEPITSFTGATQGAWTNWVTVPMSLFTSTGFTFKFGTSKTDINYNPYRYYAIWDKCELRVSKTKQV